MKPFHTIAIPHKNIFEIIATDGKISEEEIEDKIKEAFRQLGMEIDL